MSIKSLVQKLFFVLAIPFLYAQEGIVVVDEWEAQIEGGGGTGADPATLLELKTKTFIIFETRGGNAYYPNNVVILDENHQQIWRSESYEWIDFVIAEEDKFVILVKGINWDPKQVAIFYRIENDVVTEVGRTSTFTNQDAPTWVTVSGFGGLSDVAEHEDSNDARYAELDTSSNVRSVSFDGRKLTVRHYRFGADGNQNNDVVKIPDVLFSGSSNGNAIISWSSQLGAKYQVQKSTDLENWIDVGLLLDGTGGPMTYEEAIEDTDLFFRIRLN